MNLERYVLGPVRELAGITQEDVSGKQHKEVR